MKRIVTLLFLCIGLTAAAQNLRNSDRYEHFKELRNEADTLGMKQLLDDWGDQDAEYYAAWSNYCSVMAEEKMDASWLELAVNWIKMGLEEYPDNMLLTLKYPQVLIDNEQWQDAFPILQDIDGKDWEDTASWIYLAQYYVLVNDLDKAREYFGKVARSGDEDEKAAALQALAAIDLDLHERDSLMLHPDHAAIREFAKTEDFQKLVARFEACDTTLTREEFATIYYGSAYGKDYNLVSRTSDDIRNLAAEGKDREAAEALQAKLKEYPVSLFLILSLLNMTEDDDIVQACVWKANALLGTIDFSGQGTPESPHQVICVNDEYTTLEQVFEMASFIGQGLVDNTEPLAPLDRMTFRSAYGVERTVYFYLTPPYWERLSALMQ